MRTPKSWGPQWLLATAGLVLSAAALAAYPASAQSNSKSITIVLGEEPEELDPCNMARSTVGRVVRQNIAETLTEINPKDGSVTPRLATSWEQVDPKTWRFKLRQGVKFHDGTSFNAAAVVKTIERTYNTPALFCENKMKSGLKTLKGTAVDEFTVDISAEGPEPIMPVRMGVLGISSPNTSMEKVVLEPVGSGPYKFEGWNPAVEVILVRNDDYWGDKPVVERARYIHRKESAVRAAMVEIGEADLAPDIAVQDANNSDLDYSFLNSESTRLRLDVMTAPLNDKRVRLALNYALDRDALRGSVFSKDVLHSTQMVVPSIAGHNHEIDKNIRPYDPAKAKALLAEAKKDGVPVDKEIVFICRTNQWPGATEAMEALLGQFLEVGLNVKLRCLEVAEHSAMQRKPFAENRLILFQDQHDNNNGDPVFTAFTKYGCEGAQSTACVPALDALIAKATALPTGPERTKTWEEVFRVIYEDEVLDVTLFHMVGYSRVGKRINYTPSIAINSEVQIRDITFK